MSAAQGQYIRRLRKRANLTGRGLAMQVRISAPELCDVCWVELGHEDHAEDDCSGWLP